MLLIIILKAFLTGFCAACLVGPIFTLILYRTVTGGVKIGLFSALGMALADGIFFSLSVFSGLSHKSFLLNQMHALEMVGGPLMITFGLWTLLRRGVVQEKNNLPKNDSFFWQIISVVLLTMSNPLTLLFFGTVAGQFFPELSLASFGEIIIVSSFLSLGSFTLVSSAIAITIWQKKISPENLVNFFKILSGTGLLLTGSILTLKSWHPIKEKIPFLKSSGSKQSEL